MRTKHFQILVNLIALAGAMMASLPVRAQEETTTRGSGSVTIGVRQLYGDRRSAKFNEYRDIPQGFYVEHMNLDFNDLLDNTFFANFQAREALERDQSYLLSLGRYRRYKVELRWDQTPHVFTTTGKTIFNEPSAGNFTVPTALRTLLEVPLPAPVPAPPASVRQALLESALSSARLLDLSLRRDTGSGKLAWSLTDSWGLDVAYGREKQVGYRPFGTTMYFGFVNELPEPINYRTHKINLGTEYSSDRAGLQIGYGASIFNNLVSTLRWENPFRLRDFNDGPANGQLDLYADNSAQNISFAGAVNIVQSTRLMASVTPGWMRQNDDFLPYTVNTAIPVCPANNTFLPPPRPADSMCVPSTLPASSLDGKKQTLAMNYRISSKAIPQVPLVLRYRSYDYNNDTPSLTFGDYVASDMHVLGYTRRSLPFAYDRKNLGLDAAFEVARNTTAAFVYEFERMDREHRDLEESNENTLGIKLDANPQDWLTLRASYRHSDRDAEHYEANEESFVQGEGPFSLGQIHGLRKIDEAARKRHRVEALLQLDPTDLLGFALTYGTTQDNFEESEYGLQQDINYNYGFELTLSPHDALAFFGEYTREKYKYRQRSRQRTPASATAPVNDHPNNDWESTRRDTVDTWAAGIDGNLNGRATYSLFYSLASAKNKVATRALGVPGLAGAPAFLPTTASSYPDTSNRWHQVVSWIKFPVGSGISPKLEYRYEKYDRIDFALENVVQYSILDTSLVNSIFLGIGTDIPGYDAHIVSASLEYRF